ncbi:MAG: GNAT family N-acetyltransferase [Chloroflexota bacterium]
MNETLSLTITFNPVVRSQIDPYLQLYLKTTSSPFESFLEGFILGSAFSEIFVQGTSVGYFAVHNHSLLTQFYVRPQFRRLSQQIFKAVVDRPEIETLFVYTGDEFFLSYAIESKIPFEMQAYFFQALPDFAMVEADPQFSLREARLEDIPFVTGHSGDFFDLIDERINRNEIFIGSRDGEIVSFGIIETSQLYEKTASIGMFVLETERQKGYGTQTILALKRRCLDNGVRPIAGCWYYNHNSKKTLEKTGMFTQTRLLKFKK